MGVGGFKSQMSPVSLYLQLHMVVDDSNKKQEGCHYDTESQRGGTVGIAVHCN